METIELLDGCVLREWKLSDVDAFVNGISHPDISRNLRPEFPSTREQIIEFIEVSHLKSKIQDFAIVNGNSLVGGISFIIHENYSIELACLWIAEPYRGHGIAQGVIMTMITYVKQHYPDYNIQGKVYEYNKPEIRMVEKIGFKKTGSEVVFCSGANVSLLHYEYS